jgi:predicted nucleic acid-binding protein
VKVLVDACVWSLMLRRRGKTVLSYEEASARASLTEAIENDSVVIIGPIRQEVLSGIRDQAQFAKLRTRLAAFHDVPLSAVHYEEAARLFNLCRQRGVECGATDILICAVASQMRWSILTNDRGLERCIQVLRAEGLSL